MSLVDDPRIASFLVKSASDANFILCGYPDDEGIKLNGGRAGASEGPAEIRKAFFKMTTAALTPTYLFDAGDLNKNLALNKRHEIAQNNAEKFYQDGKFVMSLGGGHDYGYPDTQAFLNAHKNSKLKPVVINFDAHLDVRPLEKGLTSGTPFFRMLTENPDACHFFEVGIQDQCNSESHRSWCKKNGGKIISLEEIEAQGLLKVLKKSLSKFKNHPCFISVDIDAFSSAYAPGCSQSWPVGLKPDEFFKAFDFLFQHLSVKGIGIYEVSPPLDVQPLTSRLAALILYRCLKRKALKNEKSTRIRKR